jgi:tRNA nucleotidyltransferase (CCA-adding enzyme)
VLRVLGTLGRAGHRSWIVGGAVRDLLLRRVRHDPDEFDVATPATPEQVQALFPRVLPTGIEHGTVTVLEGGKRVEVTTFRSEGAYEDGRRPSSVRFLGDLHEDLARRDFTVNALAWDPLAREFRDPFGGVADLRRKVIRAVGVASERFAEDGLRPLRAVRFASQLGFRLDRRTREAIPAAAPVVGQVSRERVAEELSRLLSGRHAGHALELLEGTGLLQVVLPHLGERPAGGVRHAVRVARDVVGDGPADVADAGGAERVRLLRLAGLLHDLPAEVAMRSVVELRLPNRLAVGVAARVAAGGCLTGRPPPDPAGGTAVRRWLADVGLEVARDLLDLWAADARHQGAATRARLAAVARLRSRVRRELSGRPPLTVGELALDGRAVMRLTGIPGGPAVGEALRHLLDRVVEDPSANRPDRLEFELRAWAARRPGPGV